MKKILFFLAAFVFSISAVMADSFGIYVVTDKMEVAPGDTIRAYILLTCLADEYEDAPFEVGLDYDKEIFEFVNKGDISIREGWEFEPDGGSTDKIYGTIRPLEYAWDTFDESEAELLTRECYESGASIIGNIQLKVKDGVKNQETKIYALFENDKDGYTPVKIYSKSDDNNLSSLSIEGFDLLFKKDVTKYDISVPYKTESVNLNYACSGIGCKTTNNGKMNKSLNVGNNTVEIEVTSETGDTKKYTVNINRQSPNNSSVLSLLELTDNKDEKIELKFNKEVYTYNVEVVNDINYLKVKAACEAQGCKVDYKDVFDLDVGLNTLNVVVTAENGDTSTYVINVSREEKVDTTIIDDKKNTDTTTIGEKQEKKPIVTILICVCVLLVLIIATLVFMMIKKKKDSIDYEDFDD